MRRKNRDRLLTHILERLKRDQLPARVRLRLAELGGKLVNERKNLSYAQARAELSGLLIGEPDDRAADVVVPQDGVPPERSDGEPGGRREGRPRTEHYPVQ